MSAPAYATGFFATMAVGTNELSTRQWAVRKTTEADRAANSKSGKYKIPLTTYESFIATIMADIEFTNAFFSAGPTIDVQNSLTSLNFYQNQPARGALGSITTPGSNANPGWMASNGVVMNLDEIAEVRGTAVQYYTFVIECYGTITTPY